MTPEKKNPQNLRNEEIRWSHIGLLTNSLVAEHLWSHMRNKIHKILFIYLL